MRLNDNIFGVSPEQLAKAQRNVEFAKQFNALHPQIVATAQNQSFGKKLRNAVKARVDMRTTAQTRKDKSEQDKRESARYRKVQSRPRTKSD